MEMENNNIHENVENKKIFAMNVSYIQFELSNKQEL